MTDDLLAKPLADLAAGVRNGSWDAQDLMEQSQARIAQTDANLHAWGSRSPARPPPMVCHWGCS